MPSPPRTLIPKTVVLITTRMQEGLPMVPTKYMKVILEGIIGRAYGNYKVTVCHYIFMANHLHILIVVEDPECVAAFMDRIKTESAHAINKLLGRKQRSVWCDGYDSPPILTLEDVISRIAYIYTNPQAANLVERIEQYPGLSSWNMYTNDQNGFVARWVQRPMIKKLKNASLTNKEQEVIAKDLLSQTQKRVVFRFFPNAWMKQFGITKVDEIKRINDEIILLVRQTEDEYQEVRLKKRQSVLGANKLKSQRMDLSFSPKKFGRRMYCICRDIPLRIAFITFIKKLLAKGRTVTARWKLGDFSIPYPIGLFPPRMARIGNLMPCVITDLLA